eukprot:13271541-Heterocapsa_arctica.AAC.1
MKLGSEVLALGMRLPAGTKILERHMFNRGVMRMCRREGRRTRSGWESHGPLKSSSPRPRSSPTPSATRPSPAT